MNIKPARLSPVVLAVTGALIIAACGASKPGGSTHASSTASTSSSRAKLVACLKSHGVTLPNRRFGGGQGSFGGGPPSGGSGTTPSGSPPGGFAGGGGGGGYGFFHNSKFATAFKDCGAKFGGFGQGHFSGHFRPHFSQTTLKAFVSCVDKHGYKLPKPNTSGSGPIFPRSIESNKKFQAASKSCASLLRPTASASSSTSSSS